MNFDSFNFDQSILDAISAARFREPTPIQHEVIPKFLNGRDMIACAQTGTGKTAAFVLPLLQLIGKSKNNKALILVPTRELAIQIDQQIEGFSYFLPINSIAIYGGGDGLDFSQQKKALTESGNIIVATPGKLISHLNLGYVSFEKFTHFILDEADRLLDMNFYDDIKKIRAELVHLKQTALFSATMETKIRKLASELLRNPVEITIKLAKPSERISQEAYLVEHSHKFNLLLNLIKKHPNFKSVIVFTSFKKDIKMLVTALSSSGINVKGISSLLEQKEREDILQKFKAKKVKILIATDVISRGIDIEDIDLVVNYDVPSNAQEYVHRVGRTARAEKYGAAITFIDRKNRLKMEKIEKLIGYKIDKLSYPLAKR